MDARDLLPMGEISRRSGFAASAIRFYEAEGLIEAHRSGGGQRRFERSVLRRLAFIRAASNVGLSIEEIRDELGRLPGNRTPTKADWHRISRHWGARLDEQIAALQRLKGGLDSCIGCGCLSLRSCAFSNAGDWAASQGRLGRRLGPTPKGVLRSGLGELAHGLGAGVRRKPRPEVARVLDTARGLDVAADVERGQGCCACRVWFSVSAAWSAEVTDRLDHEDEEVTARGKSGHRPLGVRDGGTRPAEIAKAVSEFRTQLGVIEVAEPVRVGASLSALEDPHAG
jgi:MerR family redox-sensitive transcriptional activator SoxR